jgi:glycosyltransferase involved in cell wall biosynthesis
MPLPVLIRKFRSACYYAGEEWSRWQSARKAAQRQHSFDLWINELRKQPPEVLVGGNFVDLGGTRQHMHAIKKFSSYDVELAPSDKVMEVLSPHNVMRDFREQFLSFSPKGIRAVHSHVFPWFVEWCHHYQGQGARWIHTHHNWYYPEFGKGALDPWQEEFNKTFIFALSHADVCLSVSRWQQKFLRETYGLETHYIPNGVDVELCDRSDAARCFSRYGMKKFILYVGRNDPVKNPEDYVRLAARLPELNFLMIGQGLNREVLENEWELTVPRNLTVHGEATHQEVMDAIAACSVLVITSKREGLPTLVMEGMAHGKPVVVPDEDGCMEVIGGEEFGFIYEKGNLDHLAATTLNALADGSRRHRARQRIIEEYDWRVIIKKLDAIYRGDECP